MHTLGCPRVTGPFSGLQRRPLLRGLGHSSEFLRVLRTPVSPFLFSYLSDCYFLRLPNLYTRTFQSSSIRLIFHIVSLC